MYIRLERLIVRRSSTRLAIHGVGIPNINESKRKIHTYILRRIARILTRDPTPELKFMMRSESVMPAWATVVLFRS